MEGPISQLVGRVASTLGVCECAVEKLLFAVLLVGLVQTLRLLLPVCTSLGKYFGRSSNLRKQGEWAVITGATDGIGKAYAREMARRGLKVMLISRTEEKLQKVRDEIVADFGVEVDTLAVDCSKLGDDFEVRRVERHLRANERDIGVLVNNVGMSYPFTMYFDELSMEEVQRLVTLNVTSALVMTRLVLPGMKERRRGRIVNIGSGAARIDNPLLAAYSGVKAAIERFSTSLDAECRRFGVRVQVQYPLFVTTKLAKIRHSSLMVPTPETFAKCAAKHIGHDSSVSPYWAHALQLYIMESLPSFLMNKLATGKHLAIRKKGMKKRAAKAQ
ncbi:MAG: hypothetical protein MHM6MM_004389 [Cercozoa sp. M6MM]